MAEMPTTATYDLQAALKELEGMDAVGSPAYEAAVKNIEKHSARSAVSDARPSVNWIGYENHELPTRTELSAALSASQPY